MREGGGGKEGGREGYCILNTKNRIHTQNSYSIHAEYVQYAYIIYYRKHAVYIYGVDESFLNLLLHTQLNRYTISYV